MPRVTGEFRKVNDEEVPHNTSEASEDSFKLKNIVVSI
jgi:hypothetical protein